MKNYILVGILILAIIAVPVYIFSSGNVRTAKVSEFNQIIVSGKSPCNIIITQGDTESVRVENGSLTTYGNPEVRNKALYLIPKVYFGPAMPVTYYITVKNINSIVMTGPGSVNMQANNLKLDNLSIQINNGACNISNLTVNNLHINSDSSGGFYISGNAINQIVSINGHGTYNATNLASKTATISINGPGTATVRVSDLLNAIINGPGSIYYMDRPKITKQISSNGNIRQIPG